MLSKRELDDLHQSAKEMQERLKTMAILNVEIAKSLRSVQAAQTTNVKVTQQTEYLVK